MKLTWIIFFLGVIYATADEKVPPPPPNHNNVTTEEPVTKPSSKTTTSVQTTTTSESTTTTKTTTPKPTTTTTTKSTTTTKLTTTTRPTTTTTTTTTEKPTKPTPKPTPPSPIAPVQGNWTANYTGTNKTCIRIQAAIQFEFIYGPKNATHTYPLNVPINATVVGDCSVNSSVQSISLEWDGSTNITDLIRLNFNKTKSNEYELESLDVVLNVLFPGDENATFLNLTHNRAEFVTPLAYSYKCAHVQTFNLTTTQPETNATYYIHISQLRVQAFLDAPNADFGEARDCLGSGTPDVVPIAVGCALAVLVIIVLVAYLIGRRRSQARGYLSMFTETKREEDYIPMKNFSCFK